MAVLPLQTNGLCLRFGGPPRLRASGMVAGCILLLALVVAVARAGSAEVLLAAADDGELQPVISRMTGVHAERQAAWRFWLGTLAGHSVVVARTEGDPLNAVAATTLGIRRYAPRLVVIFGRARAHDPALHPGDVVISRSFAAFDGMESPVAPAAGGSDSLKWSPLPHLLMTPGGRETPAPAVEADPGAMAAIARLPLAKGRIIAGVLGSANQVNREADRIAWLREHWGTSCEDGESAHVALCARLLAVPVVGWRVIDGASGEAAALVPPFLEAWK